MWDSLLELYSTLLVVLKVPKTTFENLSATPHSRNQDNSQTCEQCRVKWFLFWIPVQKEALLNKRLAEPKLRRLANITLRRTSPKCTSCIVISISLHTRSRCMFCSSQPHSLVQKKRKKSFWKVLWSGDYLEQCCCYFWRVTLLLSFSNYFFGIRTPIC